MTYEELGQMLLDGKISPQEFVKKINEITEEESEKHSEPFEPHEHI